MLVVNNSAGGYSKKFLPANQHRLCLLTKNLSSVLSGSLLILSTQIEGEAGI
jgi:hypothetical protein